VTLIWQGVDASQLAATVYRRDPATEWRDLGTPSAEATDRLRYEDRAVSPGTRYAYRLSHRDGEVERFTDETWVEVPRAFEFALAGLRPNPAIGTPRAAFSLPDDSPARLDLLDVSGRRIASRDVGSLGAGQHVVALEEAHGIEPGIYWLRLTRDGEARTVRGVVSR
jgi:hypothetical protein